MVLFKIEIDIDDPGLASISAARQCVTVMRNVDSFVHTAVEVGRDQATAVPDFQVAWLAFQPMESNVITWTEQVGVYASLALPPPPGVIGVVTKPLDLAPGQTATLQNGFFALGSPSGRPDHRATNLQAPLVYLGLLAAATLNDVTRPAAPINIQPVLRNQSADLSVDPMTITVFLSNVRTDGTLLPADDFGGLTLTLDSTSPSAKVGFTDDTNAFFCK